MAVGKLRGRKFWKINQDKAKWGFGRISSCSELYTPLTLIRHIAMVLPDFVVVGREVMIKDHPFKTEETSFILNILY